MREPIMIGYVPSDLNSLLPRGRRPSLWAVLDMLAGCCWERSNRFDATVQAVADEIGMTCGYARRLLYELESLGLILIEKDVKRHVCGFKVPWLNRKGVML